MLLMIDNYDSFTYNVVQYLGELGETVEVHRNDEIDLETVRDKQPSHIVISPGPCTPDEAGISMDVIRAFAGKIPILGICLGHQCIGQVYGGKIIKADQVMHGKTSEIYHTGESVFGGVESPFVATRYHSLIIDPSTLPDCLDVTAWTERDGQVFEIMGVRHKEYALEGVQFHPESILTAHGHKLLSNFLARGR